jgi:hypothetical protein
VQLAIAHWLPEYAKSFFMVLGVGGRRAMTEIHEKAPKGAVLVPRGEALNLYIITGLRLLGNRLGDGVISPSHQVSIGLCAVVRVV